MRTKPSSFPANIIGCFLSDIGLFFDDPLYIDSITPSMRTLLLEFRFKAIKLGYKPIEYSLDLDPIDLFSNVQQSDNDKES